MLKATTKRESRESSKVGFNDKQQEEEEEKNLLMFVVMFIKVLINYWSITKKYVVEK